MNKKTIIRINKIFSRCRSLLGDKAWAEIIKNLGINFELEEFPSYIAQLAREEKVPKYISELAAFEWVKYAMSFSPLGAGKDIERIKINPTLEIYELSYDFSELFTSEGPWGDIKIKKNKETVLLWRSPKTGKVNIKKAADDDMISMKIAIENIATKDIVKETGLSVSDIDNMLLAKSDEGMILMPMSKIKRDPSFCDDIGSIPDEQLRADIFTIQWHITNVCDLHCKHCYDRDKRSPLTLNQGKKVLNDLDEFCKKKNVRGHVCFSGGNPFLSPHFFSLYKETAERGYSTSILGNPTTKKELQQLIDMQKPEYFQVSLEGLEEHNDLIRGKGFFKKVIAFLDLLKEMNISSAVMLTLTKDNINEVFLLADELSKHSDYFTFNRLSNVGEGKNLLLPKKKEYTQFLKKYVKAYKTNPILGFKDNLINIVLEKKGVKPFGGCTGYGCGAAFSFATILPDGEVHACRKFPSIIGNILESSLLDIYNSKKAGKYRLGSEACNKCSLKPYCGGCLAATSGAGMDIFKDEDPYCFK